MSLDEILNAFAADVTGFGSASVVHRDEGTAIASVSLDDGGVDGAVADAYLAEMLKHHRRAQTELGDDSGTEDLVVETAQGILVARPLSETDYIWTVAAASPANASLTRALMRKYHDRVLEALP